MAFEDDHKDEFLSCRGGVIPREFELVCPGDIVPVLTVAVELFDTLVPDPQPGAFGVGAVEFELVQNSKRNRPNALLASP